jgi:hypothetical protein
MPRRPERTRDPSFNREARPEGFRRSGTNARATSDTNGELSAETQTGEQREPQQQADRTRRTEARPALPAGRAAQRVAPAEVPPKEAPPPKEPDANAEIALAGVAPVKLRHAPAAKKDKPRTGKEALAQKARDPKHGRRRGGGPTSSAAVRAEQQAAKKAAPTEEEESPISSSDDEAEGEIEIPKRPNLWQRFVSIFKRNK